MALIFPDLKIHYIDIKLPEYVGHKESFKTSDVIQIPYQSNQSGLSLSCKLEHIPSAIKSQIVTFYYTNLGSPFTLTSNFYKYFPSVIQSQINVMSLWVFQGAITVKPFTIGTARQIYDLDFEIRAVLS